MAEQIGVRELRQNASEWLRRVKQGESFEITDRGRPVAMLVPPRTAGVVERLIAKGLAVPAAGSYEDLGPPPPPGSGVPLPSELLAEMRDDERF